MGPIPCSNPDEGVASQKALRVSYEKLRRDLGGQEKSEPVRVT